MVKKGEIMKGAKPGGRLAYDATKDTHKKLASKTTMSRATTTKGNARKTAPVGARLAFDGKKKAPVHRAGGGATRAGAGALAKWRASLNKAHKQLGTSGVPRKGSKAYTLAMKFHKGGK